jgi:hypothetical protein
MKKSKAELKYAHDHAHDHHHHNTHTRPDFGAHWGSELTPKPICEDHPFVGMVGCDADHSKVCSRDENRSCHVDTDTYCKQNDFIQPGQPVSIPPKTIPHHGDRHSHHTRCNAYNHHIANNTHSPDHRHHHNHNHHHNHGGHHHHQRHIPDEEELVLYFMANEQMAHNTGTITYLVLVLIFAFFAGFVVWRWVA